MQMSQPVQRRSQRTAPVSAGKCGNGAKPPPWGPCSLRVLPGEPEAPSNQLADRVGALHWSLVPTWHSNDGRMGKPGPLPAAHI